MRAIAEGRVQMREVKVNRENLLSKVVANRDKHVAEYKEAVAGYKVEAAEKVEEAHRKAVKALADGKKNALTRIADMTDADVERGPGDHIVVVQGFSVSLRVPQNHEKDYSAVISMLELCVDETIMLRADEHACYVMDDWDWKQDFQTVAMSYAGKAGR